MDATESGSDPPPQSTSARTELPAPVKMNAWAETSRTSSTSAYSLEERCCFVCCCEIKGVELVCPCECNARFMHIECQLKMMQHTVAHREGCPVCQSKYRNVRTSRTQVRRLTREGLFLLLWASGNVLLGGMGAYFINLWRTEYDDDDKDVFLYLGISFIALAVFLFIIACAALRAVPFVTSSIVVHMSLGGKEVAVHAMPMIVTSDVTSEQVEQVLPL